MDPLLNVLASLGLNLATNAVYDIVKKIATDKQANYSQVVYDIQNKLTMYKVSVKAETIIKALSQRGLLVIQESHLIAGQELVFGSTSGKAIFGDNSTMTTNKTSISAGAGAFIETNGNAQIRHNSDGSISFHVG
ncbi:MAG: hypothetical protein HQL55_10760 [Magnetococcales bacterium]|nr:hypothetical protein [Magnetococcales bacterium]